MCRCSDGCSFEDAAPVATGQFHSGIPAVEVLTAGFWVTAIPALPTDPAPVLLPGSAWWLPLAAGWLLASWLLAMALIDVDHLWLLESLCCRWGVVAGLLTTVLMATGDAVAATLLAHLLASCLALLGQEGLSALGVRLLGQPALGLGDAKLATLLGAWLKPAGVAAARDRPLAVFSERFSAFWPVLAVPWAFANPSPSVRFLRSEAGWCG